MIEESVSATSAMNPDESPVKVMPDNSVQVELDHDHPGFNDPVYRRRRNEIAAIAANHERGGPIAEVEYTEEEHEVWRLVHSKLSALYPQYACSTFLRGFEDLALSSDHVPQLREVSDKLKPLSGFQLNPVAGLVSPKTFYSILADRYFLATQYIRHPSVPLYTPEPDILHEVMGHANMLACPDFARMAEQVGRAARRLETDGALDFLSRVFWFTVEFGVVREDGVVKAYGAGILSSFGETKAFQDAEIRPLDFVAMGTQRYDITHYQPVLFGPDSYGELIDRTAAFFSSYDDEAHAELTHRLGR